MTTIQAPDMNASIQARGAVRALQGGKWFALVGTEVWAKNPGERFTEDHAIYGDDGALFTARPGETCAQALCRLFVTRATSSEGQWGIDHPYND